MMRISQHEFPPSGPCPHCDRPPSEAERSCVFRDVPRARPPSFMAGDCTSIGDEGRAIAAREWQPEAEAK
jgi:hypothetical protein